MLFTKERRDVHVQFLQCHLDDLSEACAAFDTQRLLVIFFSLSGLDLMYALDTTLDESKRKECIEWIYRQQMIPDNDDDIKNGKFGFRTSNICEQYDFCNLTLTYCALSSLVILGDDLVRVDRKSILRGLRFHQQDCGAFIQSIIEKEFDLRVTYSAAAICYILNDWSSINVHQMEKYILSCLTYENGFGQTTGAEAHGGVTYCALASLSLMDRLHSALSEKQRSLLVKWCLERQISGFQGRTGKVPDSCYSFWIGGSLAILDSYKLVHDEYDRCFLGTAQDVNGGFAKTPGSYPDILHTYMSISALSLRIAANIDNRSTDVRPVFPILNISERALADLKNIQSNWID